MLKEIKEICLDDFPSVVVNDLLRRAEDKSKWETRDDFLVYLDFDDGLFETITGLAKCEKSFNELIYQKAACGYILSFNYFVDGDIIYGASVRFDYDILDLYGVTEDTKPDSEYGKMTVENFFNDNVDAVIQRIKDYAPDVIEEIEDKHLRRLVVSDLTEPLYWEVVADYLKKQLKNAEA